MSRSRSRRPLRRARPQGQLAHNVTAVLRPTGVAEPTDNPNVADGMRSTSLRVFRNDVIKLFAGRLIRRVRHPHAAQRAPLRLRTQRPLILGRHPVEVRPQRRTSTVVLLSPPSPQDLGILGVTRLSAVPTEGGAHLRGARTTLRAALGRPRSQLTLRLGRVCTLTRAIHDVALARMKLLTTPRTGLPGKALMSSPVTRSALARMIFRPAATCGRAPPAALPTSKNGSLPAARPTLHDRHNHRGVAIFVFAIFEPGLLTGPIRRLRDLFTTVLTATVLNGHGGAVHTSVQNQILLLERRRPRARTRGLLTLSS